MPAPKRFFIAGGIFVALILAVILLREPCLSAIGRSLVDDGAPEQADAILVLAGDWRGTRILKACEVARGGYAPVVLVSGPVSWYGLNEADQAIRYAVEKGCPADRFEALHIPALSTAEEAEVISPELERRKIRKVLIVTSNFHTARARRTFEAVLQNRVQVRMVAAPDMYFHPDSWWRVREGQKTVFFELSKTIANWVGL